MAEVAKNVNETRWRHATGGYTIALTLGVVLNGA